MLRQNHRRHARCYAAIVSIEEIISFVISKILRLQLEIDGYMNYMCRFAPRTNLELLRRVRWECDGPPCLRT